MIVIHRLSMAHLCPVHSAADIDAVGQTPWNLANLANLANRAKAGVCGASAVGGTWRPSFIRASREVVDTWGIKMSIARKPLGWSN